MFLTLAFCEFSTIIVVEYVQVLTSIHPNNRKLKTYDKHIDARLYKRFTFAWRAQQMAIVGMICRKAESLLNSEKCVQNSKPELQIVKWKFTDINSSKLWLSVSTKAKATKKKVMIVAHLFDSVCTPYLAMNWLSFRSIFTDLLPVCCVHFSYCALFQYSIWMHELPFSSACTAARTFVI